MVDGSAHLCYDENVNCRKAVTHLKKLTILQIISILLLLIAILAIACAVTGTGSGFLDLSNIARAACVCAAVVCTILAFVAWKYAKSSD